MSNPDFPPTYPRVLPVGEAAFTVELSASVDSALNRRVHALDAALAATATGGIVECVPSYRSLLVIYDPDTVSSACLGSLLLELALAVPAADTATTGRVVEIPVQYGGEAGPDLEDVARHCHLTPTEVIRLHSRTAYQVAMLGFTPGFAYLLGLPQALSTPRLETPRFRVEPGSVGIAGDQTGVYALSSPGGWRIIGRTPLELFDLRRPDPFMLKAGDEVQFVES
ncbi:MAG: 5-oxoprolinase subunit PxpB [Anaerolineae bacterium]|jgi:KipI family sensor histidine kinase inhibitor|nr:5-oxoprolinase subunit PxpB [Anaerolineae bacterium]